MKTPLDQNPQHQLAAQTQPQTPETPAPNAAVATLKSATIKVANNIDLKARLPFPTTFDSGTFVHYDGVTYIPFFNPDNDQFRKFLTARLLSPTQGACINDKTFYAAGEGLQLKDDKPFPKEFDRKINSKQTIDDILRLIFDAIFQDGNKFIEVVRTEVAGKKVVHVYEHSNLDCRLVDNGEEDPTEVIRSRAFRKGRILSKQQVEGVVLPLWTDNPEPGYNPWKADEAPDQEDTGYTVETEDNAMLTEEEKKAQAQAEPPAGITVERTMFHLKNELSGIIGYGLPTNFAGLIHASNEYKAAKFNSDGFDNNMFLGGVLTVQGQMSPAEEKNFTKNIKRVHTGDGTAQRILVLTASEGITDTKFTPFQQEHDGNFIELAEHSEGEIIKTNNWSKELLDLNDSATMGKGGSHLATLFKGKYKTAIKPVQDNVLNNFVFPLMKIIDEWTGSHFYEMEWHIKPSIPVSFEGALDINSLLTVDEGREALSLAPLEDEEMGKRIIVTLKGQKQPGAEDPNATDTTTGTAKPAKKTKKASKEGGTK